MFPAWMNARGNSADVRVSGDCSDNTKLSPVARNRGRSGRPGLILTSDLGNNASVIMLVRVGSGDQLQHLWFGSSSVVGK